MSLFNRNASFKQAYGTHGILGIDLGFSSDKSSSSFNEKSDEEIKKSQSTLGTIQESEVQSKTATSDKSSTGTSTSKEQSLSDQLSQVSNLDEETQLLLQNMLASISGGATDLVGAQQERALSTEERLAGTTDAIIANAEARGEEQVGAALQGFSRSAGSSQNSIVQQLGLQESGRVNREIADLAATLGIQVDQIATQNIDTAAKSGGDLIAQLSSVLKGAESTSAVQTQQTSENEVTQILQELLAQQEAGTKQSTQTQQELIDSLLVGTRTASGSGSGESSGFSLGFSGSDKAF